MPSALHFVHQCVKKEVQVFLLKEIYIYYIYVYIYMYVCVCARVRNVREHTNITSPTLLAGLMGRGRAWSRGCLWCGRAVSCLVRVLPYLLLSSPSPSLPALPPGPARSRLPAERLVPVRGRPRLRGEGEAGRSGPGRAAGVPARPSPPRRPLGRSP